MDASHAKPAASILALNARAEADRLAAASDAMEEAGRTLDLVRSQRDRAIERVNKTAAAHDRLTTELRDERRLRQTAQADLVNLLSVLASARLADAGLSTADLALIDRIEQRWTKESGE